MAMVKIYKGYACLEAQTPQGALWWYQPGKLAYSPIPIREIKRVVMGKVGVKKVLAVPVLWGGRETYIALNTPRTDLWTLAQSGLIPEGWPMPQVAPVYTAVPNI